MLYKYIFTHYYCINALTNNIHYCYSKCTIKLLLLFKHTIMYLMTIFGPISQQDGKKPPMREIQLAKQQIVQTNHNLYLYKIIYIVPSTMLIMEIGVTTLKQIICIVVLAPLGLDNANDLLLCGDNNYIVINFQDILQCY